MALLMAHWPTAGLMPEYTAEAARPGKNSKKYNNAYQHTGDG